MDHGARSMAAGTLHPLSFLGNVRPRLYQQVTPLRVRWHVARALGAAATRCLGGLLLAACFISFLASRAQTVPGQDVVAEPLEINGPANPWRFVHAVGERAGIWGFENGVIEGWVYPLKIFHDFSLAFQVEGSPTIYPAEQLVRAVRVRPESVELQYSEERFTVTETLFTPRHEAGFAILLRVA